MRKGIGSEQLRSLTGSREKVLKSLQDGKLHRYGEIAGKTRLSSRTLAKHLRALEADGIIERTLDTEGDEYPYPVRYKIKAKSKAMLLTEGFASAGEWKKTMDLILPGVRRNEKTDSDVEALHVMIQTLPPAFLFGYFYRICKAYAYKNHVDAAFYVEQSKNTMTYFLDAMYAALEKASQCQVEKFLDEMNKNPDDKESVEFFVSLVDGEKTLLDFLQEKFRADEKQ